ncbi:TPA: YkyA family protein [Bacillus wiedmannii]|uniref:YkyA family protein n=1 Tax=Bacillus wiedmannii TaxID=1890302 RepID=UPI00065BDADD|nr:YkyA family protein [Bacillus wiedmannii]KMP78327.1 lipoprotein [Bacillus cereus]MCQ6544272.1 YkyA family protein [Bacillus wiedmannii]MCQ6570129.1 YkyA family protein [Bacillus wiedmannii]MCU5577419.1 YkyA family protein [Bacillus wiedmannii]WMS83952.1 YkyA family protein [Bacillus wiedmannii]
MKYGKVAVVGALSVGLLTGCFGEKPEENLYTAFEAAATQEKSLVDEAKKLEKLEKDGQELYSQILQEGKDHNDAVMKKIEQATANVDDREKVLKNEKEMLEKAQKETKSVQGNIEKLEDKKLQKQAKAVEESYKNRYDAFQKMNENYTKALATEKELYEKLKVKETKLKEIGEKVKAVNELTVEAQKSKEQFNNFTKEYNDSKLAFYKDAEIKMKDQK